MSAIDHASPFLDDLRCETDGLTGRQQRAIKCPMTGVLTVRLSEDLLEKAEAKAARMGMDGRRYVRTLIEEDLADSTKKPEPTAWKFASEDLAEMYETSGLPATNTALKERLRKSVCGSLSPLSDW